MAHQITTFNFLENLRVTEVLWMEDNRQVWLFESNGKVVGTEVNETKAFKKIIELMKKADQKRADSLIA